MKKRIAILGGGPSGLFLFKTLLESAQQNFTIDVFEAKNKLGSGMPYSWEGASLEHVTNVSGNEIPDLMTSVMEWIDQLPEETLADYNVDKQTFHEFKVFPRLLFGEYLNAQFNLLRQRAQEAGIETTVHLESPVTDIMDAPGQNKVIVEIAGKDLWEFDNAIICTGHNWMMTHEGKVPGYFDSPYPPVKLKQHLDHEIALRGSSLTAIDAVRTLARQHGTFLREESHKLAFHPHENAKNFKIVMHSRNGLLPAVRFHLADSHLSDKSLLSKDDIAHHMKQNGGFLSLDFIFEQDFKEPLRKKDPAFYNRIKDLKIEEFVEDMMSLRESVHPFMLLKSEYSEAAKSIRRKESVHWKEMLAILSFAMNYPAKHFSAEDMLRLQHVLMPLISVVIAFVPQSSCEDLLALYDAGRLDLISVGIDSNIEIHPETGIIYHHTDNEGKKQQATYKTFIDCIGQRHLMLDAFPFKSLVSNGTVSAARIRFRSPEIALTKKKDGNEEIEMDENDGYYLKVPGIAITDSFRAVGKNGSQNPRIHVMAVPYIGGFNPDYSGLDFCEEASALIVEDIFQEAEKAALNIAV